MKSAVCLLVPMAAQKPDLSLSTARFLSVSRRHDATRWGLPGGKVDPGESNIEAVLREVQEEIGLTLSAQELEPLFCDVCPGKGPDDTYWVTTYLWKRPYGPLEQGVSPEEGLTVSWLQEEDLTEPRKSPFAAYNQGVFEAFRKRLKHPA